MNEIQTSQNNDSNGTPTAPKRPHLVGCLLKAIAGLVLLAIALYGIQSLIAPDVIDDQTVEINSGDNGSDEISATDTDESGEQPRGLVGTISNEKIKSADHPLDPLMDLADASLKIIDSKYQDYSAKMLSQVRTEGKLHDENLMFVKVRHEREEVGGKMNKVPFAIYTRFLKPKSKVGQEAIWVRGKDDEKILGHGTGLFNVKTVRLDPAGGFAMSGNRYPIYQIGFRNLIVKMKEFGVNDREYDECEVSIERNVKVDGRSCTVLKVTHPVKRDHFDYHIAKIYIDDEYEIPTGYEGYLWPETPGADPPLLEKYFYLELKLNPDLKDIDFDIANPDYNYPAW